MSPAPDLLMNYGLVVVFAWGVCRAGGGTGSGCSDATRNRRPVRLRANGPRVGDYRGDGCHRRRRHALVCARPLPRHPRARRAMPVLPGCGLPHPARQRAIRRASAAVSDLAQVSAWREPARRGPRPARSRFAPTVFSFMPRPRTAHTAKHCATSPKVWKRDDVEAWVGLTVKGARVMR